MMKNRLLALFTLFMSTAAASYGQQYDFSTAATSEGKVIVFRFKAESDVFYAPWEGNGEKFEELCANVEHYKKQISDGKVKLEVDGYCSSLPTQAENLKSAGVRANRVKSELIVKAGVVEKNFLTKVHALSYNDWQSAVVVTLRIPNGEPATKAAPAPAVEPQRAPEPVPPAPIDNPQPVAQPTPAPAPQPVAQTAPASPVEPTVKPQSVSMRRNDRFSIRTNLLYLLGATINGGVEWRPSEKFSASVSYQWAGWEWDNDNNRYRMSIVTPEVRWYLGQNRRWFVGANAFAGTFNMKFDETGRQGDVYGGGAVGGYRTQLSRTFDMDFSLGLGYARLDYEEYTRDQGVSVMGKRGLTKNYFGPTQIGVSLIWKIK